MAENESGRYQKLLSEFAATKLPSFYRKYNGQQSSEVHDSFSAQPKCSDLFPQTWPIERFLNIPAPIRKRRFFEDVSVGHIVEGLVTDKWADILSVRLHSVYHGPTRWINDLKIKGECDLSEFKTHSGSRRLSDSISDFDLGDHVRGVVSNVHGKDMSIAISFRRSLLPDHLSHTELGAIEDPNIMALDVINEDDSTPYLEHLKSLPCFENPELANNLARHLGIDVKRPCTFLDSLSTEVDPDELGHKLRERQSTKWSMRMVANGVALFKESKNEEALKCFDQALQMHPTNVEALVARGALKANQNKLKAAIQDFHDALQVHPSHRNGRKYLCETLVSLAKQQEKDRMWKEASRYYKEALDMNADHETARDRFHQIRIILSQQVLAGKINPVPDQSSVAKKPEVVRVNDGLQRSKSLIELLKKKVSKRGKKRKQKRSKPKKKGKRRKSRNYSSSDSSAIDSDCNESEVTESASEKPSSESEAEWVEKTIDDNAFGEQRAGPSGERDRGKTGVDRSEQKAPLEKVPERIGSRNAKEDGKDKYKQKSSSSMPAGKGDHLGGEAGSRRDTDYENEAYLDRASAETTRGRHSRDDVRRVTAHTGGVGRAEEADHRTDRSESAGCIEEEKVKRKRSGGEAAVGRGARSSQRGLPEEKSVSYQRTHFSNDEISFINSLLKKKS